MASSVQNDAAIGGPICAPEQDTTAGKAIRIKSQDLFQQRREVEIEHDGRIYRLRITQLNKLILTA
jgi:hemin uptake protein HemP